MFSESNSHLGGSNNTRPGQSQYSQQQQSLQQQPGSFQTGLAPQPTGYGGAPSQPHFTSFPGQSLGYSQQPQYTGYLGQQGQPLQHQQAMPQITFQTSVPQQNQRQHHPHQQHQQQSPIGIMSTEMAQSLPPPVPAKSSKIPTIRLSFITAQDQAKFEQLFKSAVGDAQALSGDQARDLLIRSKLPGEALSHIWTLCDTTKSGQLLFPEFALAMYLCNVKLTGKELPNILPDRIRNEVSSMVDIISFGVPEEHAHSAAQANNAPSIQQPPSRASSSQQLSPLAVQSISFGPTQVGMQPRPTGSTHTPTTGHGQPTGGYSGPRPPIPVMPTGYDPMPSPSHVGMVLLNAQPTGIPGQWGLVNTPATGLPNIEALAARMMPQTGRDSASHTTDGLTGNANIPWAITKGEKKLYDETFRAWDGMGKGYISGAQALEIFGQSGLPKPDLERVWTLADSADRGRLDLDEFAIAMHLIYRKLNGYPIPARLPPELVPPSTRNINESIGAMKSLLRGDAEDRKNSGAFLQPQRTGVSYLKSHTFQSHNSPAGERKDATVFRNNDDNVGYKSSARRRLAAVSRSPSPAQLASPSSETWVESSLESLRKSVKEKQILLDAIDARDQHVADKEDALDRRDRREAEDLYRRIRRVQEEIDTHPRAELRSTDSDAERRILKRQLLVLTDRLSEIASNVRRTEREIADARLELFRLRDAKAHPGSAPTVVGTGPGGCVTEADRLKARAKAMMQTRSAALIGHSVPATDDAGAATERFEQENLRVRAERDNNERMIRLVEDSVSEYTKGLELSLKKREHDNTSQHERRRWEDALGVEDEIKDFIFDLQRSSRVSQAFKDDSSHDTNRPSARSEQKRPAPEPRDVSSFASPVSGPRPAGLKAASNNSEERGAFIKKQAEQRMAERLAALGIKAPIKGSETPQQRAEREKKERADKLRRAEEEDMRREEERQRRLNDESTAPPVTTKTSGKRPAPPPPVSRKAKADVPQHGVPESDPEPGRLNHDQAENVFREQRAAREIENRRMEEEERAEENEFALEREAAQARLRALEEQVKQVKLMKAEEKTRREAAQMDAKEKQDRSAARRAEMDAARERERQLQLQLEAMEDDESPDDGHEKTSQDNTRTISQELTRDSDPPAAPPMLSAPQNTPPSSVASPPPSLTSSHPGLGDTETKNPFLKKMALTSLENNVLAPQPLLSNASEVSTNPFHRLTQENANKAIIPTLNETTASPARRLDKQDDDDWSVVDSDDSSSDQDEGPSQGGAKHLASILFGTMAPPRPLSSMGNKSPRTDSPAASSPAAIPPPPPPPPPFPLGSATPSTPGPPPPPSNIALPPPPMPSIKHARGAPNRGALLGEIAAGKGLRKVETKDRSTSSLAGRVL